MRYPKIGEKMKFNLKNRPKTCFKESSFTKWFEGFEGEQRKIALEPKKWLDRNLDRIAAFFGHHSVSGLTPEELLKFYITMEILGEEQK
jgi:hypothetical protein